MLLFTCHSFLSWFPAKQLTKHKPNWFCRFHRKGCNGKNPWVGNVLKIQSKRSCTVSSGQTDRQKERRIMPSLLATTSALARKPCVHTHYVRTNNAKFSGHYVFPRTHNMRAYAQCSHQFPTYYHSTHLGVDFMWSGLNWCGLDFLLERNSISTGSFKLDDHIDYIYGWFACFRDLWMDLLKVM